MQNDIKVQENNFLCQNGSSRYSEVIFISNNRADTSKTSQEKQNEHDGSRTKNSFSGKNNFFASKSIPIQKHHKKLKHEEILVSRKYGGVDLPQRKRGN